MMKKTVSRNCLSAGLLSLAFTVPFAVSAISAATAASAVNGAESSGAISSYEISPRDPKQLSPTLAARKLLAPDAPLRVRWALPLNEGEVKQILVPPVETDLPYLLIETDRKDLIAVNNDDGRALWWVNLPDAIRGKIAFGKRNLYFTIGNRLVALERMSGDLVWNVPISFAASSGPAINENENGAFIFLPSFNHFLYCLEISGEDWSPKTSTLRAKKFGVRIDRADEIWKYKLKGAAVGEPAFDAKRNAIYVASLGKELYGINFAKTVENGVVDPDQTWTFHTQRSQTVAPVIFDDKVLLVSEDQSLYCIDAASAELAWKYVASAPLNAAPQKIYDANLDRVCLVQPVADEALVGIDSRTGKALWQHQNSRYVVGMISADDPQENLRATAITLDNDRQLSAVKISAFCPFPKTVRDAMKNRGLTYDAALAEAVKKVAAAEKVTYEEAEKIVARQEKSARAAKRDGVTVNAATKTVAEEERLNELLQRDYQAAVAWRLPVDQFGLFAIKNFGQDVIKGETVGNNYIFCTTADQKTVCVLEANR